MVFPVQETVSNATRPAFSDQSSGSPRSDLLAGQGGAGSLAPKGLAEALATEIERDARRAGHDGSRILQDLYAAERGEFAVHLLDRLAPSDIDALGNSAEGRRFLAQIHAELTPAQTDTPNARAIELALGQDVRGPSDMTSDRQALLWDLGQIGLGVAGIVDPTPISDGVDAVISLFRGDMVGLGIAAVSMVPFIGDLAKIGKLGDMVQTIDRAVDLARVDPAFARSTRAILERLHGGISEIPLDKLPPAAREPVQQMQRKLDDFFAGAGRVAPEFSDGARHVDPATGRPMIDASRGTSKARNTVLDGPLEPNVLYRTDNGYRYHTDGHSRVERVEGRIEIDRTQTRSNERQRQVVEDHGVGGRGVHDPDTGGHIIKRTWGGPAEKINLVPQPASVNNGSYARMEQYVDTFKNKRTNTVDADIRLSYPDGASARPDTMEATIRVTDRDGRLIDTREFEFDNRRPESRR